MKRGPKESINAERIKERVRELGAEITRDFAGRELTVVGVLKGAFLFMADLVREIDLPLRCDFLRVESYDDHGKSGSIRLEFDLTQPIEGKDVLLIEDILDTGKTIQYILSHLAVKKPKSLTICCLLDKGLVPELSKQVRYVGFRIPPEYVVGYGLDLAGLYRELPYVGVLDPSDAKEV
ncbi:MAG: hypoxanthine phosphoribosyltransferase [bacterium]